jgi:coenzyme F420 hydrogenase subunit beta
MPTQNEHSGASAPFAPRFDAAAPGRTLCTDCGVSRMADPSLCGSACQFIQPDYDALEARVHGRIRDAARPDELHFGPFRQMLRARLEPAVEGAQWTGIATTLGEKLLEGGHVDAVLATSPHEDDRWRPQPMLITRAEDMARARGMRMGYGPLLALLEPAREKGIKRLAIIGIPCQVYALRALEEQLGFDEIFVIGTPCSDNTTTESFHQFLTLLDDAPETICYLEFRADFMVELRFDDGRRREIPFLKLPISKLPPDFFPLTCRTCVDYTNVLADITVGYMGGSGDQWLIVRNERGERLVSLLGDALETKPFIDKGKREGSVKGFLANTERAAGGLPLRGMPDWARPIVGWLMPRIGPRGLEFARARVEMKAIETVLHLRRAMPAKMKNMVPDHVWALVERYGLTPQDGERK